MPSKPSTPQPLPRDFEKTITYDTASYILGPGVDANDLKLSEDWRGRPASEWSVRRIGLLQARIEQYMYSIYNRHNHSYYYYRNNNVNNINNHNIDRNSNSNNDRSQSQTQQNGLSQIRKTKIVSTRNIPTYKLINFANEAFGYDGWYTEIVNVETHVCHTVPNRSAANARGEDSSTNFKGLNFDITVEAEVKLMLRDGTYTEGSGVGRGILPSKGASYGKAKKQAVNNAIKNCMLSFEVIILDYNEKVKGNYYVDDLFVNKIKTEESNFLRYK